MSKHKCWMVLPVITGRDPYWDVVCGSCGETRAFEDPSVTYLLDTRQAAEKLWQHLRSQDATKLFYRDFWGCCGDPEIRKIRRLDPAGLMGIGGALYQICCATCRLSTSYYPAAELAETAWLQNHRYRQVYVEVLDTPNEVGR